MTTQSTEDLLHDFTIFSLQSQKLDRKIKQLTRIKDIIDTKAAKAFEVYEDRKKQEGQEIPVPNLVQDIEEALES